MQRLEGVCTVIADIVLCLSVVDFVISMLSYCGVAVYGAVWGW